MERHVDINEISDGRKYSSNDLVKIGCNDCAGCSKCCQDMAGLIVLDPYDIFRLCKGIDGATFDSLLTGNIELNVDRGILLPSLKMDEGTGICTFLNENGRCRIHNFRPGICRLFPLGRAYEDGGFYYFLQVDECDYKIKTKVKIKNWLETEELSKYEKYINDWHYFLSDLRTRIEDTTEDEIRQINMSLLQIFFISPYSDDFYEDFYTRLSKVKKLL